MICYRHLVVREVYVRKGTRRGRIINFRCNLNPINRSQQNRYAVGCLVTREASAKSE